MSPGAELPSSACRSVISPRSEVMTHWNCQDLASVLSLAVPGEEADHGAGAAVPGVP
jgi:hypothetical protein